MAQNKDKKKDQKGSRIKKGSGPGKTHIFKLNRLASRLILNHYIYCKYIFFCYLVVHFASPFNTLSAMVCLYVGARTHFIIN